MKGYIYKIGNTVCILLKEHGKEGGWFATGATVPQAFQSLITRMKTS